MSFRQIDGIMICPHGLRPFLDPCCPACSQEARDRFEGDMLAMQDPEGDAARREWDDWYASPDMVHALHGRDVPS